MEAKLLCSVLCLLACFQEDQSTQETTKTGGDKDMWL